MVAAERDELALVVLDGDAETVGVGVGAEHDVGMDLIGQFDAHGERFFELGIGHLDRGKFRVGIGLFLDHRYVDAQLFEDGRDGDITRTVYGRIDKFEVLAAFFDGLGRKRQFGQLFNVRRVHFGRHGHNERTVFLALYGEIVGDPFDVPDDLRGVFGGHLCAVFAVYFIAVVFLGIVRRGDHDTRDRMQIAYGIGEHGYGMHLVKEVGLDAVRREHAGGGFGKLRRLAAGVIGNDDAAPDCFGAQGLDELGESLCGAHDRIDIHHVHAVPDDAAHARRAEFELAAETVFDRLDVVLHRFQLGDALLAKTLVVQPKFKVFSVIHFFRSLFMIDFLLN